MASKILGVVKGMKCPNCGAEMAYYRELVDDYVCLNCNHVWRRG